jgi:hypothetical protein
MSVVKFVLGGLALLLVSTAAFAFQEQSGVSAPASTPAQTPSAALDVPSVADRPIGTDVRIPGLGRLGSLPKMDFGLELLYGASDSKGQEPIQQRDEPRDDLTIRGTVKHNF